MKLTRVTFTELHEVVGAFGREWLAPAGGGFPKHLIHSYDLKTKTIIFPPEWNIEESVWLPEEGRRDHSVYQFRFGNFCHTFLQCQYIKRLEFIEIDYAPEEFRPDLELVVMTLRIPRRNRNRTDKLIQKYRTVKTIIAERSRESNFISEVGGKKKTLPQYTYELIMYKAKWHDFAKQLFHKKLVPQGDRFMIIVKEGVFPRELAVFKNFEAA